MSYSTVFLAEDLPSQDPMGNWITDVLFTKGIIPLIIASIAIIWLIGVCYWSFHHKAPWRIPVAMLVLAATPMVLILAGWLSLMMGLAGWWTNQVLHPHLGLWGIVIWLVIIIAFVILIIIQRKWGLLVWPIVLALPLVLHHWLPSVAGVVWRLLIVVIMFCIVALVTVVATFMMFYTSYQVAEQGAGATMLVIGWLVVLFMATMLIGGLGGLAVFMETWLG